MGLRVAWGSICIADMRNAMTEFCVEGWRDAEDIGGGSKGPLLPLPPLILLKAAMPLPLPLEGTALETKDAWLEIALCTEAALGPVPSTCSTTSLGSIAAIVVARRDRCRRERARWHTAAAAGSR